MDNFGSQTNYIAGLVFSVGYVIVLFSSQEMYESRVGNPRQKNRQVGQHKTTAKIALDPGNRAFLTGYDGENVLEIGKGDIGRSRGDKLVESYM